jgi:hypothetical protein
MPNWCNNYLELTHEDPAMIERAKRAFAEGKLLEEFCPVPASLHIVAGRVGDDTDPKQIELEAQEKANLETHGYSTWYDYCVNEWGTKWDVGGDGDQASQDSPTDLRMNFDSAWAPPVAAMEKFQDLGFKVKLVYWESGMCFCGLFDENGDDYLDYTDMTADEVDAAINDEVDECMCIVENLREWEEQNAEEEDETPHEFATPGSFTVEGGVVIGGGSLEEDSAALTEQLQAIAQSLNKENK